MKISLLQRFTENKMKETMPEEIMDIITMFEAKQVMRGFGEKTLVGKMTRGEAAKIYKEKHEKLKTR